MRRLSKRAFSNQQEDLLDVKRGMGETYEPVAVAATISEYLAAIGKRGGIKGGKVRAEKLSPERKSEIARKAAQARWKDKRA